MPLILLEIVRQNMIYIIRGQKVMMAAFYFQT
jgi:hypothetical protein